MGFLFILRVRVSRRDRRDEFRDVERCGSCFLNIFKAGVATFQKDQWKRTDLCSLISEGWVSTPLVSVFTKRTETIAVFGTVSHDC